MILKLNQCPLFSLQIKVWFQNRRTKQKRDHSKIGEAPKCKSDAGSTSPPSMDFLRMFPTTTTSHSAAAAAAAAAASFSVFSGPHPGHLQPASSLYNPFSPCPPPHLPPGFPGLTGLPPTHPHPHYPLSFAGLPTGLSPPCNLR